MNVARFWAVIHSLILGCSLPAVALLSASTSVASETAGSSRAWDFDLKTPGTYSLQIEHALNGIAAGSTKATYTITVGEETQSHEHDLIVDRPFVPLRLDIRSARRMHVVITGISAAALEHTSVQLLGGSPATTRADTQTGSALDLIPANIQQQLALPEGQIDIGLAALTFAKEINPGIDVQAYSRKIDVLADEVRSLAQNTQDPERRIRVLNTVLFRKEGFHYDRDPFSRSVQKYYFLDGILDTKQGICYTMPLLYPSVSR